ncbi:MAG: xylulokinase [Pseudomonadota bacterium]
MYLGIDLGTSAVKAILVDDAQAIIGQASAPLTVERRQPLWSEQDPESWWQATTNAISALRADHAGPLADVRAIGLSGQMHGATLLDVGDSPLRPAILWNDGRSFAECAALERAVPNLTTITGNRAMPGFTAPKLLWVKTHEPDVFARVDRVLLPKDYLRLRLTGEAISDMSDAAGTLWLDVGHRRWSPALLDATGLDEQAMPSLAEGSDAAGHLRRDIATQLGLPAGIPVAGGAGDNAAGAAGIGIVDPGRAFVSLGTSGVVFAVSDGFKTDPDNGLHALCHCLPNRWHKMAVILSAASCLDWASRAFGFDDVGLLIEAAETVDPSGSLPLFLPYLSGERTPHNDPNAQGVLFGLTHSTDRAQMAYAVLEGVAFALSDGLNVLIDAGTEIDALSVIGGGARSTAWGRMIASAFDRPLHYHEGGDVGPAFGAARLARLAAGGEAVSDVCTAPPIREIVEPDTALTRSMAPRRATFGALYRDLRDRFAAPQQLSD